MPLDPIDEERLQALEEQIQRLKRRGRGLTSNPLALSTDLDDIGSVKTYLTIEKPAQAPGTPPADVYYLYGHRTRRMQMTVGAFPDIAAARMRFTDGVAATSLFGVRIPADWVAGTDLTLNIPLYSSAAGNMIFDSQITAHSENEEQVLGNVENVFLQVHARDAAQIEVLTRTIPEAAASADEMIRWAFIRQGGAGADTLGANVDAFYGAYLEYTAWF